MRCGGWWRCTVVEPEPEPAHHYFPFFITVSKSAALAHTHMACRASWCAAALDNPPRART